MNRLVYFLVLFLALCACARSGDGESSSDEDGKCKFTGNDPSIVYCATTYVQILSDPHYYHGRRVMVSGWAYSDGDIVLVFPSEDSLLSVEDNASMLVIEGEGDRKLSRYLVAREYGAGRVVVAGVFKLDNDDSRANGRFGVLEEAELIR